MHTGTPDTWPVLPAASKNRNTPVAAMSVVSVSKDLTTTQLFPLVRRLQLGMLSRDHTTAGVRADQRADQIATPELGTEKRRHYSFNTVVSIKCKSGIFAAIHEITISSKSILESTKTWERDSRPSKHAFPSIRTCNKILRVSCRPTGRLQCCLAGGTFRMMITKFDRAA